MSEEEIRYCNNDIYTLQNYYREVMYKDLYCYEKLILLLDTIDESNILIKLICKLLRNYFIHRWEVYFDEEEKKSNKKKKSTYKGRIKKKKV